MNPVIQFNRKELARTFVELQLVGSPSFSSDPIELNRGSLHPLSKEYRSVGLADYTPSVRSLGIEVVRSGLAMHELLSYVSFFPVHLTSSDRGWGQ